MAAVHEDEQGRPVAGVKITVTLPDVGSFRVEETTDGKGNYALTLLDATRTELRRDVSLLRSDR